MFYWRDLFGAHFSAMAGRSRILDDIVLPGWFDRRLGWSRKRNEQRLRRVERAEAEPMRSKDASTDW